MINLVGLPPCAARFFAMVELVNSVEPVPFKPYWKFEGEYLEGVCLWDCLQICRIWTAAWNREEKTWGELENFWSDDTEVLLSIRKTREAVWENRPETFLPPKKMSVLRRMGLVGGSSIRRAEYARLAHQLKTGQRLLPGVTVRLRGVSGVTDRKVKRL